MQPAITTLLANGLSLVANAVLAKGRDYVEEQSGVRVRARLSSKQLLQLKEYETKHQKDLIKLRVKDNPLDLEVQKMIVEQLAAAKSGVAEDELQVHAELPSNVFVESRGKNITPAAINALTRTGPGLPLMERIQQGSDNERAVVLLQSALKQLGYVKGIDGRFGAGTAEAVKRFQRDKSLVADGVVGEKSWTTLISLVPDLFKAIASKWIGDQDFVAAAQNLQVDEPALRAIYTVESGGAGFLGVQPKILFEGHVFWAQLQERKIDPSAHVRGNEDILYPKWTSKFYKGGLGEYERLERARAIDEIAALRSASWGLFQIMGYHAERLGYANVKVFVAKMTEHEREQLNAFCEFVRITKSRGKSLLELLRKHDWAAFAFGYNGAGYKTNRYDEKLAAAFVQHGGQAG